MTEVPWAYRPYEPASDEAFIYASWIESARSGDIAKSMRNIGQARGSHAWAKGQHALIAQIIAREHAHVTVACTKDNTTQIIGWVCWESRRDAFVIHHVVTKRQPVNYQRMGVAKGLLTPLLKMGRMVYCSHMTPEAEDVLVRHPMDKIAMGFTYSPYLAFMPETDM